MSERVGRDSEFKICKTIGIMGLKGRSGRNDGIEEPYRESQKLNMICPLHTRCFEMS